MNRQDKKECIVFVMICFILSWLLWLPPALLNINSKLFLICGTFSPLTAALILSAFFGGKKQLRKLFKPLLYWRTGIDIYLFSFFSTAAAAAAAISIFLATGGTKPEFNDPRKLYLVIPFFLYVLIFSVSGEETGWRGYLLPRLLKQFAPLQSSLIIGFVWGFWHFPLFLDKNNFHSEIPFILFLIQTILISIIYTWLYERTDGSLLIAHIFHAASNTTLGVLPVLPQDNNGNLIPLIVTICILAAVSLFFTYREKMWKKQQPYKLESIF